MVSLPLHMYSRNTEVANLCAAMDTLIDQDEWFIEPTYFQQERMEFYKFYFIAA